VLFVTPFFLEGGLGLRPQQASWSWPPCRWSWAWPPRTGSTLHPPWACDSSVGECDMW